MVEIKKLSTEEIKEAQSIFNKLSEQEIANVDSVKDVVDKLATRYLTSQEPHYYNYEFIDHEVKGYPFFALYFIAGLVNKNRPTKDIDLLFSTNMKFNPYFFNNSDDARMDYYEREVFWMALTGELKERFDIEKKGKLPQSYDCGVTKGKTLITLVPKDGTRKIDLNYVRHDFITREIFEKKDGLERMIFYKAEGETHRIKEYYPLTW